MTKTFDGTWETTWESDSGNYTGLFLTVSESLRSDRSGSVLDGMYDLTNRHPGTMHGKLTGNVWEGDWINSPTDRGTFNLKLGEDDSFTGTYTFDVKTGRWPWYSTRLKRRHVDVVAK